jgi:ribonuclease-3
MKTSTPHSKTSTSNPQIIPTPDFNKLENDIGINFTNKELLKNAFIHRSYLNEHKNYKGQSNERLEFLGDAVLSIVVSTFLFEKLPSSPEGELTQLRAALVRTETLAKLAQKLSLGNFLYLSKGEEDSGGRNNNSILANTFEALIGAIYLDQGTKVAEKFLADNVLLKWKELASTAVSDNKSKLQEVLQKLYHESPSYKIITSWGPDHDRRFEMGVYLGEKCLGKGVGKNKQEAAQNAAKNALPKLEQGKTTSNLNFQPKV